MQGVHVCEYLKNGYSEVKYPGERHPHCVHCLRTRLGPRPLSLQETRSSRSYAGLITSRGECVSLVQVQRVPLCSAQAVCQSIDSPQAHPQLSIFQSP